MLSSASRLLTELGGPDLARVARFDDPDGMAAAARLDGVIVASRTEDHARDSLAFTGRGTPVFVEKPFANSIAEAADFCGRLGDGPNRLVQVGFQRHFDAAARAALDWVSAAASERSSSRITSCRTRIRHRSATRAAALRPTWRFISCSRP